MGKRPVKQKRPRLSGPFLGALQIFILPVGVFLLAVILFAVLGFDIDELVAEVKRKLFENGRSQIDPFAEIYARLSWASTLLLFYCAFIAAAVYCFRLLRRSPEAKGKRRVVASGVGTGILVLIYIACSAFVKNNFSYMFYFTFDILKASQHYSGPELTGISVALFSLNILAGLVPVLALVSGCCVLVPRQDARGLTVEGLKAQMGELKEVLGLGAVLLAAGVLHMVAWLRWPSALVNSEQGALEVLRFSEAMGLYWGATFSLVLAAFYLPAAWSICSRAERVFEQHGEDTHGVDPEEWLRKHGLTMAPSRQIPQFAAVLAPLLAEPIGSALVQVSESAVVGI